MSTQNLQTERSFDEVRQKSARGAIMTFGSQGLRILVIFCSQVVLTHMLLPAQFGIVAMAAPMFGVINIFMDLGLAQATIQRDEISQAELSSLFWVNFALSLLLALGMLLISPLVQRMYHEPRVGPVIIALGCILPMSGLSVQAIAIMNRRMQFPALAAMDVASTSTGMLAAILAAWFGAGYWALVIQLAVGSLVQLVMVWPLSKWKPSSPGVEPGIGPLLRFGGHLTGYNIVSYFTSYFDNILVGVFNGAVALGFFERAFTLVLQPISQITAPVGRVAIPMLSRMLGSDDAYRRAYTRMMQLALLVTLPGLLCASILSSDVVLALLGRSWAGTAPILAWLSFAGMCSVFTVASCWLFITQDRVREQMRCGFSSSALIVIAFFAGVHWGPVGVAASYAAFAPIVHGVYIWASTRRGPVSLRDVLMACYPIVIAVGVTALALRQGRAHLHLAAIPAVLLGTLFSYAFSMAVLAALPAGKRMLLEIWALRSLLAKPQQA